MIEAVKNAISTHYGKIEIKICELLEEDRIVLINEKIDRLRCNIMPNGNKIYTFDSKPFLELFPIELKGDGMNMTIEQKYRTFGKGDINGKVRGKK